MIKTVTRSQKNPKADIGMIEGIKKNMISGIERGFSGNLQISVTNENGISRSGKMVKNDVTQRETRLTTVIVTLPSNLFVRF